MPDNLTVLVPDGAPTASRSDIAYYLIRDLVVTLALAPGAPVREPDLMARLGLGRTPVREALRRLADDGLITIWPRRGMVVSNVDVRDLASISEVRLELEPAAARLAAHRVGGSGGYRAAEPAARRIERLEELIVEVDRVSEDPRQLIRLDQRVHRFVHEAAGNRYLARTLEEYLVLSLRLWFLGLDRVGHLDDAVREHRDLLLAVGAGDAARAAATAREHVREFQVEIGRVLTGR
ncbi:GntR family transcriptional regulator [Georgenia halophila]|uniref:GntR family transcriptional regulator n=2 Tax=Georgenia halophila TaxID=620889 RepID=A0ABP8LSB6_9MICO